MARGDSSKRRRVANERQLPTLDNRGTRARRNSGVRPEQDHDQA